MTEREVWRRVLQPLLHHPPDRVAWKVQDAFRKGLPDVLGRVGGRAYLLEHKHPTLPARPTSQVSLGLHPAQRAHLLEWGGVERGAFILVTGERAGDLLCWLLPPETPNELTLGELRTWPEHVLSGERGGARALVDRLAIPR